MAPDANAKLESINFTRQITAILADAGGKPASLGNPLIRTVNTKASEVERFLSRSRSRFQAGERKVGTRNLKKKKKKEKGNGRTGGNCDRTK